jgi:hypothetical protein
MVVDAVLQGGSSFGGIHFLPVYTSRLSSLHVLMLFEIHFQKLNSATDIFKYELARSCAILPTLPGIMASFAAVCSSVLIDVSPQFIE